MRLSLVRFAVVLVALLPIAGSGWAQDPLPAVEWTKYRDRFVTGDGRVMDTGNHVVSHSEGQGWAMLFAESFDDRASLDKIWEWTRDRLQRHDNSLFSWRWNPLDTKNPVADANDASDGDILIAWALTRAARHWGKSEYGPNALRIIRDIRRKLIRPLPGRLVLLPGLHGFEAADGTTIVNPSYYLYPAFKEFADIDSPRVWHRLGQEGLKLLADARFGRWQLTPDWVDIDDAGEVTPSLDFPARFGFDAIRVPLYLVWGGEDARLLDNYLNFWNAFGDKPVPAWVDVTDGAVASYAAPAGFQAIIQLARNPHAADAPPLPAIGAGDDYYSASLILLADLARHAAAADARDPLLRAATHRSGVPR